MSSQSRRLLLGLLVILVLGACGGSDPVVADGYDCRENTPGTGDLSVDIVGRWRFIQNASPQYFTFEDTGTVIATWTSDEHDDVTTSEYPYTVTGDSVTIDGYRGIPFEFVLGDDGLWTVFDRTVDADWIRCRRIASTSEG